MIPNDTVPVDGFVELVRFIDRDGSRVVYLSGTGSGDDDFISCPVYSGNDPVECDKAIEVARRLVSICRDYVFYDRTLENQDAPPEDQQPVEG